MSNFYDEEEQIHKSNRDQALDPKAHTKHYCLNCDAAIVSAGEKCPVCGCKDKSKHKKLYSKHQN